MGVIKNKHLDIRCSEKSLAIFSSAYEKSNCKSKEDFMLSLCQANPEVTNHGDSVNVDFPNTQPTEMKIRISSSDRELIFNLFKKNTEKKMAKFLVKAVQNAPIIIEEKKVMNSDISFEYRKACVNLNQLAKIANQTKTVESREVLTLLADIKKGLFAKSQI